MEIADQPSGVARSIKINVVGLRATRDARCCCRAVGVGSVDKWKGEMTSEGGCMD